jgi:hypothetical protein
VSEQKDPLMVECSSHGRRVSATVCQHLVKNNGAPLGFIENSSDPHDQQGWCYACEYLFLQEEDKTDKFLEFCNFAVVCEDCYSRIKAVHSV